MITKPMEGAQRGGVGGFFRGMGRGAAGLFVKPVTGVLDFASRASEGVAAASSTLASEASSTTTTALHPMALTTSMPSVTDPKTTCLPSSHEVLTVQRKNLRAARRSRLTCFCAHRCIGMWHASTAKAATPA